MRYCEIPCWPFVVVVDAVVVVANEDVAIVIPVVEGSRWQNIDEDDDIVPFGDKC